MPRSVGGGGDGVGDVGFAVDVVGAGVDDVEDGLDGAGDAADDADEDDEDVAGDFPLAAVGPRTGEVDEGGRHERKRRAGEGADEGDQVAEVGHEGGDEAHEEDDADAEQQTPQRPLVVVVVGDGRRPKGAAFLVGAVQPPLPHELLVGGRRLLGVFVVPQTTGGRHDELGAGLGVLAQLRQLDVPRGRDFVRLEVPLRRRRFFLQRRSGVVVVVVVKNVVVSVVHVAAAAVGGVVVVVVVVVVGGALLVVLARRRPVVRRPVADSAFFLDDGARELPFGFDEAEGSLEQFDGREELDRERQNDGDDGGDVGAEGEGEPEAVGGVLVHLGRDGPRGHVGPRGVRDGAHRGVGEGDDGHAGVGHGKHVLLGPGHGVLDWE
mmetsp:Transcript_18281/g.56059  ORF Transcript_18281/g.56059 Transcript_18281/m.56059 type:complete len:379 (-) Transcript_18281:717-1853(-)